MVTEHVSKTYIIFIKFQQTVYELFKRSLLFWNIPCILIETVMHCYAMNSTRFLTIDIGIGS